MADLDLVQEQLRELAAPVIEAAGNPTEPFGTYLFTPDQPESELARHVERTVFDEWFGNSPELLAAEYAVYEPSTLFISVLDHRRRLPAGGARIILPSPLGFKSLNDIESVWGHSLSEVLARTDPVLEMERIWDAVTISVAREYRGKSTDGLISLAMLQAGTQGARLTGGRFMVSILDMHVLGLHNKMLANPWRMFPGVAPLEYLGSPTSVPVFVDFEEYVPRLFAADPGMHDLLFSDHGVEAVVRGPDWAPVLRFAGMDPRPSPVTR